MSTLQTPTELEEIIDAIGDADVITDAEKKKLLTRIESEQGIVSDGLRSDVVKVLRSQAAAETDRLKDNKAVLSKGVPAVSPTPAEQADMDAIAMETRVEQSTVAASVQTIADTMRDDILRMERSASADKEAVRRKTDQQSIDDIRSTLLSPGETAA